MGRLPIVFGDCTPEAKGGEPTNDMTKGSVTFHESFLPVFQGPPAGHTFTLMSFFKIPSTTDITNP